MLFMTRWRYDVSASSRLPHKTDFWICADIRVFVLVWVCLCEFSHRTNLVFDFGYHHRHLIASVSNGRAKRREIIDEPTVKQRGGAQFSPIFRRHFCLAVELMSSIQFIFICSLVWYLCVKVDVYLRRHYICKGKRSKINIFQP